MNVLWLAALLACTSGTIGGPDDTGIDSAPDTDDTDRPEWGPSGLGSRPANPSCHAPPRATPAPGSVALERVYTALTFNLPVQVDPAPPGGRYVVEQGGKIQLAPSDPSATLASVTTALTVPVRTGGERGLLGFDLHPDFASNGHAYIYGTFDDNGLKARIMRYTSLDGGLTFDPSTAQLVLEVAQPASNHNGGQLRFGPDGLLYLALGDGGGAWDTYSNGQDPHTLLGTMVRIDVDGATPYAIPADNPFADGQDGAPELYAWGLRNPWRFAFDPFDGTLFAADVGQNAHEEIDVIELGGNYGWPLLEGPYCQLDDGCASLDVVAPIGGYDHDGGQHSITGGVVYRGTAIPSLVGTYLYADIYDAKLMGLRREPSGYTPLDLGVTGSESISSFGVDADGEALVVGYSPGSIFKIVPAPSAPASSGGPAPTLSATGCMDPGDPSQPAAGLVPWQPIAPFWSDGAAKERWMALPDGTSATVNDEGDVILPVGTVLVKQFRLSDTPVETRLLVHHEDGVWAGYTYAWRADGSDADLLEAGEERTFGDQTWSYPSRSDCMQCHTAAAGYSLSLETGQLNHDLDYGAGTGNQLHTLVSAGLLSTTLPSSPQAVSSLSDPLGVEPIDMRARSYLHANCASCHRPGTGNRSTMDLRYAVPLAATQTCGVAPELGDLDLTDPAIVLPGSPEQSVLHARMSRLDDNRMPPLGSLSIDTSGADLLAEWITQMPSCALP